MGQAILFLLKRTVPVDMSAARGPKVCEISADEPLDQKTKEVFDGVLRSIEAAVDHQSSEVDQLRRQCQEMTAANGNQTQECTALEAECARLRSTLTALQATQRQADSTMKQGSSEGTINDVSPNQDHPYKLEDQVRMGDQNGQVHGVALQGSLMASASWNGEIQLYDVARKKNVRTLKQYKLSSPNGTHEQGEMKGLYSVGFAKTPNHDHILCCTSSDYSVYVWNHQTGELLRKLVGHENEVNGIDFHEAQQVICTASDDKQAILWDFGEGVKLRTLTDHKAEVYGCTFLGKEHQYKVATCCFDKFTRIFDMRDKKCIAKLGGPSFHTDDVIGVDYSSRANTLATGSDDGKIIIWDLRNISTSQPEANQTLQTISTRNDLHDEDTEVKRVAFSPDGERLAAGVSSGQVLVYKYGGNNLGIHGILSGHSECVFDVAWGQIPNGRRVIASASHDMSSRVWQEYY